MGETTVFVVLATLGVGAVLLALLFGQRFGTKEVGFDSSKLGLKFNAQPVTLVVVLGFAFVAAGAFLWNQNYGQKLTEMQKKLDDINAKTTSSDEILRRFQLYKFNLKLVFPDNEPPPDPNNAEVEAFVRKEGERERRPYTNVAVDTGPGGISVNFDKLNLGDTVSIVVRQNGREWRSEPLPTPTAQLQMRVVKREGQ